MCRPPHTDIFTPSVPSMFVFCLTFSHIYLSVLSLSARFTGLHESERERRSLQSDRELAVRKRRVIDRGMCPIVFCWVSLMETRKGQSETVMFCSFCCLFPLWRKMWRTNQRQFGLGLQFIIFLGITLIYPDKDGTETTVLLKET